MTLVQRLCLGCLLRCIGYRADLRVAVGGVGILRRSFDDHGSSGDVEFDRGVDSEVAALIGVNKKSFFDSDNFSIILVAISISIPIIPFYHQ